MINIDIFVYGTLRQGGSNHHLLKKSKCINKKYVLKGYCLYDFEHCYPYMVKGKSDDQVVGEIYTVDESIKKELDILEDVENNLYEFIYLPTDQCYTYIKFDDRVDQMPKIKSGDWIYYLTSVL